MEKEQSEIVLEQKETIKLMKMSKGYQWEIKIVIPNETNNQTKALTDVADTFAINRLKFIDLELQKQWGGMGE